MTSTPYVYVTYIRTTQERLWEALTTTAFMRQYWFGMKFESGFTTGSPWRVETADGRLAASGEILESVPPTRLVIRWLDELKPEIKAEGYSRCVMELEPAGSAIKLTITHSMEVGGEKLIAAVSGGWPKVLSNLKSLIESGELAIK